MKLVLQRDHGYGAVNDMQISNVRLKTGDIETDKKFSCRIDSARRWSVVSHYIVKN